MSAIDVRNSMAQVERLWGAAADDDCGGGGAHSALLTTGADGVLRAWVEVPHTQALEFRHPLR